jgi:hypothetical protein
MGQKISLKRLKFELLIKGNIDKLPDYEGFFSNKINTDFYVVGWLKPLSSDLDIIITKVDDDFLNANKFNRKKYFDWKYNKK